MGINDREFENGQKALVQAESVRVLHALTAVQIEINLPVPTWTISSFNDGIMGQLTHYGTNRNGDVYRSDRQSKENIRAWAQAFSCTTKFQPWETRPGGEYGIKFTLDDVPVHIWAYIKKAR